MLLKILTGFFKKCKKKIEIEIENMAMQHCSASNSE